MSTQYKRLGNTSPNADTFSTLYQVPAGASSIISTISICNATASVAAYSIGVSGSAATSLAVEDYVVFNSLVDISDTTFITVGMSMDSRQKIIVRASSASITFTAFGAEIT